MPMCSICKSIESGSSRCPPCNREYMRAYRIANLEKVKSGQRDHYARNRDEVIRKTKAYAAENREKIKSTRAKRYDETKEERRIKIRKWQEENPEKRKEIMRTACLNRVARKAKAAGKHSIKDIRKLYDLQKGECVACHVSLLDGYHVDHIIPLSKNGDNGPENLQLLCPPCNLRKSDMSMDQFLARNFPRT